MSTRDLTTHILPALLAGNRGGLKLDRAGVATPLQALALTAQALRFERPGLPASFHAEEAITDSRAIVPEAIRRPMVRLLTRKASGMAPNLVPDAIARVMAAQRLRLHPFDLPRLETFVRGHGEALGAEATAFAQRQAAPDERRGYFDADALDDETWMLATPATRHAYIASRRRGDPAAARALVEAVWASESADLRVRLLSALQEGLSPGDEAFLASLAKDRAPRVRDLAQRLLNRLPGHDGENPALKAVIGRIKTKSSGIFTKRTTLALELPANIAAHASANWVAESFENIGIEELAWATSVAAQDLPTAVEKDDNLLLGLMVMATRDKRFDVLKDVIDHLPDGWEQWQRLSLTLDDYDLVERARWAGIVVRPLTWTADGTLWSLLALPALLEGPAPDALMTDLMKARPWQAMLKDDSKLPGDLIEAMAAISPQSRRAALRAQIASLDPGKSGDALLFLDILDALETTHV